MKNIPKDAEVLRNPQNCVAAILSTMEEFSDILSSVMRHSKATSDILDKYIWVVQAEYKEILCVGKDSFWGGRGGLNRQDNDDVLEIMHRSICETFIFSA